MDKLERRIVQKRFTRYVAASARKCKKSKFIFFNSDYETILLYGE